MHARKSLQLCPALCDTLAHRAPLSKRSSRQEYWNRLLCPPPGYLPDLGLEPASLASSALTGWFFTSAWKAPIVSAVLYLIVQSCPTLCIPVELMDCSLLGFPVYEILQARVLEWVIMPSSGGSSQPRGWTQVSLVAGGFFTSWVTREAPATHSSVLAWRIP